MVNFHFHGRTKKSPKPSIMNDRLADLQEDVTSFAQEGGGVSNEHMTQFFDDVEAIKSEIAAVAGATDQIMTLKDKALLATSETKEAEISEPIRTLVEDTNGRAKKCKILLGLLKAENTNLKNEGKVKPTDLRVRENLVNTLLQKIIHEMKRYQNSQQQYKTDFKKKVTRQVKMIKLDATDEEIDQIMRSEGGREALYRQQILRGGVNDQIKTQHQAVVENPHPTQTSSWPNIFDLLCSVDCRGCSYDRTAYLDKKTLNSDEKSKSCIPQAQAPALSVRRR